ncbi:alpha/beta-type small acid-soluble spore protein [Clostridium taeniosporum]|uniref:Acid-soluble spore protein n=1 Tax=Clostridium taeniosporum TaxID=394958 RepID=A0A1D7XNX5_9CLOT|nr:alpha/beta-type small acid-soluble spore protein [Clostridium taeniosporum]AOR24900.1 acid-soluble spore protein [Clostridium taeniosporum]
MNNNAGYNNPIVPEAKGKLAQFKNEVANEMGIPFKEYNGDLSSKQCGSVGGEMVKRMVQQYENNL